ncbi:hypothetical protein OQA88_1335 [Cercophora sp. LCS_1]
MGVPIASYGTNQKVAQELSETLKPEYDVVHIALSTEAALAEIPAVASGDTGVVPSSGLGSNANADASARQVPKALIFGGGISAEEVGEVKSAVSAAAPDLKFISITHDEIEAAGGPTAENIASVLKGKLGEAGL